MSLTAGEPGGVAPPLVSIMIPTYGQASLVTRAIDSARAQTYPHIEIVVADDCSPDDTVQVVQAHLARIQDPRVRFHRHAQNLGILRNYHATLTTLVRGDWVINLDGDDFFVDPEFIACAMALVSRQPAVSLVMGNYCEVHEPAGKRVDILNRPLPEWMSDQDFLMRFARGGILWNHNAILYRRADALRKGCYWHPTLPRNDWESFLRIVIGAQVGHVPRVSAAWVQHGANETRRLDMRKYLNNFRLIDSVAAHARESGLPEAFVRNWLGLMVRKSARSSAVAYVRQNDLTGLLGFLWLVRKESLAAALRVLFWPGLWARWLLSANPALYNQVKARLRGAAHG
jgi:glycosyltransferase involved in cell wall biosynthesis